MPWTASESETPAPSATQVSQWSGLSRRPLGILQQLDLRFKRPEQERRYKQGLQQDLVLGGLVCIGSGSVAVLVAVVPVLLRELNREESLVDVRLGVFGAWAVNLLLMLSYILLSSVYLIRGSFANWNWEGFFVAVVSVFLFSMAAANYWHLPFLAGQNPMDVWAHDARGSDIFMLLGIDGTLTMVAMYVPIRSSVLWIPFVFAVVPFFVNTIAFTGVFQERHLLIFALSTLSGMAYHGALRREHTHRQKWMFEHMVNEAEEVLREQDKVIQETAAQVAGLRVVAEALCDVIVKLDSQKRVFGSHRHQDAFFETNLEGRLFGDFLSEDDRLRFEKLVQSLEVGFPGCLPVTIRKEHLTTEVSLLAVDTGPTREPRYLLGLRIESEHFVAVETEDVRAETGGFSVVPSGPRVDYEEEDDVTSWTRHATAAVPVATPVKSRALAIKKLLPRWHVPRDMTSCCQYHTAVESIHEALDLLHKTSCEPLFQTFSGQCPRCKCMYREKRRCAVCGLALREDDDNLS